MNNQYSTYNQFLSRLNSLGLFHMDMTLARTASAITPLAKALQALPVLHVVGTNGKGSTSVFLEAIARAHSLKTGLFTSPHFLDPRERLRINGRMLSEDEWIELANATADFPGCGQLTYFELLTLIALTAFVQHKVDVAIIEAGLGGTWDATCILDPELAVLTPVGMDHEKILGSTLEAIAQDKAGVLRGKPAISAAQTDEVRAVFTRTAKRTRTRLFWAQDFYRVQKDALFFQYKKDELHIPVASLGLRGAFQAHNAGLGLGAWHLFCEQQKILWSAASCMRGLQSAFHPGRFQCAGTNPLFILDGAHNVMGLQTLVKELEHQGIKPDTVIFSCMADKDVPALLHLIRQLNCTIIVPQIQDNPRAACPNTLVAELDNKATAAADMHQALHLIPQNADIVLVCGSLYLLADFYALFPHFLNEPGAQKEIIS